MVIEKFEKIMLFFLSIIHQQAKRGKKIYVPEEFHQIAQGARKPGNKYNSPPYRVRAMVKSDFLDWKSEAKKLLNTTVDSKGKAVMWPEINELSVKVWRY